MADDSVSLEEHIEEAGCELIDEIEKRLPEASCGHDSCQQTLTAEARLLLAMSILSTELVRCAADLGLESKEDVKGLIKTWAAAANYSLDAAERAALYFAEKDRGEHKDQATRASQSGPGSVH